MGLKNKEIGLWKWEEKLKRYMCECSCRDGEIIDWLESNMK